MTDIEQAAEVARLAERYGKSENSITDLAAAASFYIARPGVDRDVLALVDRALHRSLFGMSVGETFRHAGIASGTLPTDYGD